MHDKNIIENIIRRRMHHLYLSRRCEDLESLAHDLMGLHCWFYRNVVFSAIIRGADVHSIKHRLTKTWLYGRLNGVVYEDLSTLLALNVGDTKDGYYSWLMNSHGEEPIREISELIINLMEDGVCSRKEFREILSTSYEPRLLDSVFNSWGGIFVLLADQGRVAFKSMTSRDFELISAEPTQTFADVMPGLLKRYFKTYGPATLADAAWFFSLNKDAAKYIETLNLDEYARIELGRKTFYYVDDGQDVCEIPEMTLLSGFDPVLSAYTVDNRLSLPSIYKKQVVLSSGICLPTIAVDGFVAGKWNIVKNQPVVELFDTCAKKYEDEIYARIDNIIEIFKNVK